MLFHNLTHHPRKLWIRRAVFQVHLWGGVLLALYLVVIALSGSVLVFESELTRLMLPQPLRFHSGAVNVSLAQIVQSAERAYPGSSIDNVMVPNPDMPVYVLYARLSGGHEEILLGDATTGEVFVSQRTWVQWVHDLHIYLLLNKSYGMQVNAAGAAVLMVLTLTGVALWWPGVRAWARGLRVNVRANWRRVNYDLHSAIGFWTLAIVFWWALSGVYFGFYQQVTAAVNAVLPIKNLRAPGGQKPFASNSRVTLEQVVSAAQLASPQGHLYSLSDASLHDPVAYVLMDLGAPADFTHRDIVRVDVTDAKVLSVWHYSEKHSAGDWVMWLMHPLHFGTLWGMACKVLWAFFGVLLAVLTVTGVLMYWNRYLRRLLHS